MVHAKDCLLLLKKKKLGKEQSEETKRKISKNSYHTCLCFLYQAFSKYKTQQQQAQDTRLQLTSLGSHKEIE